MKHVLITGGGTGVGRGAAIRLATAGYRVTITGRREAPLQETAAQHEGIQFRSCDVSDAASVDALFNNLDPVDILINSAGINVRHRSMADLEPDEWEKLLRINATGAYSTMRKVLPTMRERGDGLIINISSVAGKRALELAGIGYCASKFAMTALGTCVGLEEAPNGIRVTNIYPGEINTPILDDRPTPVSDEHKAQILQPEDIAEAILMIAALPPRAHIPELVIKPTSQHYA